MRTIPIICSLFRTPKLFSNVYKCRNLNAAAATVTDTFVLENPELIEKRRAVVKYLNAPNFLLKKNIDDPKKIGDYNINALYDNKVSGILELCNNDLYEIDSALGLYGLAEYAEVSPDTIINNRNPQIKEIGYGNTSFRNSFYTYILANTEGRLVDLYSRFGRIGASLYDNLSVIGCEKTGLFDYKLNSLAKETLSEELCSIISAEANEDINMLFGE